MMIRKLLVIRFSALGDIAMTVPVVVSVCLNHPDIEVTMLTSRMGEKIYRAVASAIPNLTVRGINPHNDYSGIAGLNRLYGELKQERFDAVADLHDVLRTQWLRFRFSLSGKMLQHIHKGRKEKKALVKKGEHKQLKHGIIRYQEVFEQLGLNATLCYDATTMGGQLQYAVEGSHSVGIAPYAQHQGKIYPEEMMLKVIAQLLETHPERHIYLLGGPSEQKDLDRWCQLNPQRIHNTAGKQTLADDMALLSKLDCIISMDSANMHLASLVGTRVVSIWGATHIYAGFLGYGQKVEDVVEASLECRPCSIYGNKPCKYGDYRCMLSIHPETIVNTVNSL